jgi:4'-phosphopantetheinyl transferase
MLSADERERAARFHADNHRYRYIAARGRLRETLAARLATSPASLSFEYGPHGKPALAAPFAQSGWRFNISHSADMALLGLSHQRDIGVDLEFWRKLADEEALARRYFSPVEIKSYLSLDPTRRRNGFFNCWTRKEAYIKAVGRGLGLPLDSFDVSLIPGEEPRLLRLTTKVADDRKWALAALEVAPECSAAVVLEGDVCHIQGVN